MAKLPEIDEQAMEIRRLLNHRDRASAKRLAIEILAAGKAGHQTQMLAAYLFGGKGGRPPVGRYKEYEIGERAEELDSQGIGYTEIAARLKTEFGQGQSHVEKCIAAYHKGRWG